MLPDPPLCPYCSSPRTDAEFVDIGVGVQQVTPYHCFDCDAREFYDTAERLSATPEEQSVGWLKGQESP